MVRIQIKDDAVWFNKRRIFQSISIESRSQPARCINYKAMWMNYNNFAHAATKFDGIDVITSAVYRRCAARSAIFKLALKGVRWMLIPFPATKIRKWGNWELQLLTLQSVNLITRSISAALWPLNNNPTLFLFLLRALEIRKVI